MPTITATDDYWMQQALELAAKGEAAGEVPVGAVVVLDGEVIGAGWNQPIGAHDPTAHAEVMALRDAGRRLGNYRLTGSTLYVTLEPCLMCTGAMVHARVARLVFGASDPKRGAVESTCAALQMPGLNHHMEVTGGILKAVCAERLQAFFRAKRD